MNIKFKKLDANAITPVYAIDGDAGLDITASKIIKNTESEITYGTDIAIEIPYGFVGLLFPRSGIRKYGLSLSNSVGVIDSGYRGEIQFTFNKVNRAIPISDYKVGDRIGQLVIIPYPNISLIESDNLSNTVRGNDGFGSTGR